MSSTVTAVIVTDTGSLSSSDRTFASAVSSGFDVVCISRVEGASIAALVEAAISGSASDYVAIVESDGWLAEGAGAVIRTFLDNHPDADVLYADGAVLGPRGRFKNVMRPDHSPERLRCQFYWGDLVIYRRSLFDALGGLDASVPQAELYDIALRSTVVSSSIEHISQPLFIRPVLEERPLSQLALETTRHVLERHLAATGGGVVLAVGADGVHDTRRLVRGTPLISIVIPSRGIHSEINGERRCYVLDAARSIMDRSSYRNIEIVVVLDSVAEPEVISDLTEIVGEQLRIIEWAKPFNFSEKVNEGVLHSRGEFVLLLNDDVQVIESDWLESLLALAQLPGAGMSGGLLYYEDDTIQHAGHGYFKGDASHIGLDAPSSDPGPLNGYRVEREVSGVTAACAMMPRSVFLEVGGLSNLLPGNFNDVDLCMKVTWRGYSIYWTPHAKLYHFESKTRDASVHAFEVDVAWGRWGFRMHDPRYWPYPHTRPPVPRRRAP